MLNTTENNIEVVNETSLGFCIYIDTLLGGPVPVERTAAGNPFTYPTREAAEREIAEDTIERIRQFLAGERDFEDAMTVEEYVVEVDVLPDGSTVDESGNLFGRGNW
jgi:hypothetical protein